jgi:[ribosomal protein S5]-alanine N-acetyltransferase
MSLCAESLRTGEREEPRVAAQQSKTAEAFAISTARLVLRPWARQDLNRLVKLGNNYAVAKNLSTFPHPYTMPDAEQWFEMQRASLMYPDKPGGALAIMLDGEAIGGVGIHPDKPIAPELGYWLGEPYWHKGYATEAAQALVAWIFANSAWDLIVAGHYWDNHASGRVLTKLGFRYTLESMRFCLARGAEVKCLDMALTRAAWQAKAASNV